MEEVQVKVCEPQVLERAPAPSCYSARCIDALKRFGRHKDVFPSRSRWRVVGQPLRKCSACDKFIAVHFCLICRHTCAVYTGKDEEEMAPVARGLQDHILSGRHVNKRTNVTKSSIESVVKSF